MPQYPYVSAFNALVKALNQFRDSFPAKVDADTLKKFEIAPGNESYVINTLRFLNLIDEEGKRRDDVIAFFYGDDDAFAVGMEERIKTAYSGLFDDHGDNAWTKSRDSLAAWFRVTDSTTKLVGQRQATTFLTLASLAGHGKPASSSPAKTTAKTPAKKATTKKATAAEKSQATGEVAKAPTTTPEVHLPAGGHREVGLSVRIEVNLPSDGTPETYDAIFASVRKHLIDRD